jgi:protein-disulfide isomerase
MLRLVSSSFVFSAVIMLLLLGHGTAASWAEEMRVGLPVELRDRPVLGANTAAIVVVEISNFKCTQCRNFHEQVFPALRKDYIETGKIQWVVINASDDESEQYGRIFSIAHCAHRQGKYWELLDGLFSVAHRAPSVLEALVAKSPLLDRGELEICLADRTVRAAVASDFTHAARLKIRGTPTFVISKWSADGKRTESTIAGAQPLEYFRRAFDDLLKKP